MKKNFLSRCACGLPWVVEWATLEIWTFQTTFLIYITFIRKLCSAFEPEEYASIEAEYLNLGIYIKVSNIKLDAYIDDA